MKIMDISKHQGLIDFDKVKLSEKIDGIMIRASWGHFHEDEQFRRNVSECERLNIPWGAYHYSYALNEDEMKRECAGLIALLAEMETLYNKKPLLPIAIDMEDADGYKARNDTLNNKALNTKICAYTCEELEKAGYYAMIYCNLDWKNNKLNWKDLSMYDLWFARWNTSAPGVKCGMWQFTSKDRINGINGYVDMSKAYIDYPTLIKQQGLNHWNSEIEPEPEEGKTPDENGVIFGSYVDLKQPLQVLWMDENNYVLALNDKDKDSMFACPKKYFKKVG